jgi:hypothetical protein
MHEHKNKTISSMRWKQWLTHTQRAEAGFTFSQKRCWWSEDVHVMISRSGTQGATTGGSSVLGHTYGSSTSSTPSVQRGSGRKDLPNTPTPLLLSVWTQTILRQSFAKQWKWWSNKVWGGRRYKCLKEGGDEVPSYIGERGQHPIGLPNPFFSSSWWW